LQQKIIQSCIDFGEGKIPCSAGNFYTGAVNSGDGFYNISNDPNVSTQGKLNLGNKARIAVPIKEYPQEYTQLCLQCIKDAQASCPTLPSMEVGPSLCVINYYTTRAQMGWHTDKVPNLSTEDQLKVTSPIVSFSFGDAADFKYKNSRNDKEQVIILNSGDGLVFGGASRMIYHHVAKIRPNTSPKGLQLGQYPGRFNLTFREF